MLRRGLLSLLVLCHLALQHAGWVDPDTKDRDKTIRSFANRREHKLVFSDEFNQDGRTFHDGHDPRWTAMDKDDYTNYALHYYKADLVRTTRGVLNISTIVSDISFKVNNPETPDVRRATKNYQSAMINGWNKFCFTGGIVEISAKLPGEHNAGALWPAWKEQKQDAQAPQTPTCPLTRRIVAGHVAAR